MPDVTVYEAIGTLFENITAFGLLGMMVWALLTQRVVPAAALQRVTDMYEARLSEARAHCNELSEEHEKELLIVRNEGDQQSAMLRQIMDERDKRYRAVIASLEMQSVTDESIAKLVRSLSVTGDL